MTADAVRYENGVIIAESKGDKGVVFQTSDTRVQAERIELDTVHRTLHAKGAVVVERQRTRRDRPLVAQSLVDRGIYPGQKETVTETLRGQNFQYDFNKKRGTLDKAELDLTDFSVTTDQLTINGRLYIAHDVTLFPGGLSKQERDTYGTPPFSLRAQTITVDATGSAADDAPNVPSDVANGPSSVSPQSGSLRRRRARIGVQRGFLYLGKTRLLPVPSYVINTFGAGPRNPQSFSLTPRINVNSVDGLLVTTQLGYGFTPNPNGAGVTADIGLSQRLGFRGGVAAAAPTRFGTFSIGLRHNDIISTQLTDRITLNRTPEIIYSTGLRPLFKLPGGRLAGLSFSASTGHYDERLIGINNSHVDTSRISGLLNFTTRGADVPGPYLDLFARVSRYGNRSDSYRNAGFEVGYAGKLLPYVRGAISYRGTSLSGNTPFRFDQVEIRHELRTTFDISPTPRYLFPVDLRYDLDQKKLRDQTYGVLRAYKEFAYGLVYQTSRREVRVEVREGF